MGTNYRSINCALKKLKKIECALRLLSPIRIIDVDIVDNLAAHAQKHESTPLANGATAGVL